MAHRKSFTRNGTPAKGALPGVTARASARALSKRWWITAFSCGLSRVMRAIAASMRSSALTSPRRTSSACAVASRCASSSTIGGRYDGAGAKSRLARRRRSSCGAGAMGVARNAPEAPAALGVRGMREPLASSTVALLLAISLVGGCRSHQPWGSAEDSAPVRLAKWKDGHRAAISVTYDNGDLLSDGQRAVQDAILALGVRVDFELVTDDISDAKLERMRWLEAHGLGFFGHGARHVNHDRLSPEEARRSARSCFDTMQALGLKPVAFAYPTGHASRREHARRRPRGRIPERQDLPRQLAQRPVHRARRRARAGRLVRAAHPGDDGPRQ